MNLFRLALLTLGTMSFVPFAEAQTGPIGPVDEIFSAYDSNSPGCALGVIRDGEFIYRRGYGLANMEYEIPITSSTVFRIGSTSKQFTAAAIALLAEQGKLGLDDPLSKHFPGFPAWADKVTVRQLVLHTSGIRDYLQLAYLAGKVNDADYYTDEWAIGLLARQRETNFPPGDQHLYSNSGYLLMAHLVEKTSGQSLKDYAGANIFKPLGMNNTHFHDDHTHIVPLRADGYEPTEDGYRISMTTLDMVGDGGVYTTIDDLLLWDRNFYDNRLGNAGPELISQLTTPGRLNDGTALEYAFGLTVSGYRGLPRVAHGGAFVGFRADMIRFPEQRFSAIVLCNRSDGAPSRKGGKVVDHFLADVLEELPADTVEDAGTPYVPTEAELARYEGDFWEASEGFAAETRIDDGKLWAVHSPERRNELQPVGPNQFRMLDVGADVIVTFEMSGPGIERVTRTVNGNPSGVFMPFKRRQLTAEELGEYEGIYFSDELQVSYRVFAQQDRLKFRVADVPEQGLTALFGEIFENPDWGSFEFSRGPSGEVTGFVLQSGRVRNLEFSRK